MRSLRSALLDEPLPRLMAIAEAWDVGLDNATPKALVEALVTRVAEPGVVDAMRDGLPPEALAALDGLLDVDDRMPVATFERKFGVIRPMGPSRLERERPWHNPASAAEVLWYRGFIARGFDKSSPPVDLLYIPNEINSQLARSQPAPEPDATLPRIIEHSGGAPAAEGLASALLDDAVTVLAHSQNHTISTHGEWRGALRISLLPWLRDADSTRFDWLLHLLAALHLAQADASQVLRLSARAVAAWLQSPAQTQLNALRQAWANSTSWNDLAHVPGLAFDRTHTWSNDPLRERQAILNAHARWQSERTGDPFVSWLKRNHPDFARPDGRYDTWHIKDASGNLLHGFEHWDHIEGALASHITITMLGWLRAEPLSAVPAPALSDGGMLQLPGPRRYERFQLARIADPVAGAEAFTFAFSPASLTRGREQGIYIARVLAFLTRTCGTLPPSLQSALQRWDERGTEVKLGAVALLRTRDASTLDALLRHPALRDILHERVAPNAISVPAAAAEALRLAVVRAGVLID